jgi:hypothetical protein
MTDDRLHALLSAYAAGTLTAEERQALFAAAVERQDLFDSLMETEPLRELLEDPAIKAKLVAKLTPTLPKPRRIWSWGPRQLAAAGGIALLLVAGVTVSRMFREKNLSTPTEPALISQAERQNEIVGGSDSPLAQRAAPSKESVPLQNQTRQEQAVDRVGTAPSRDSLRDRPAPKRPKEVAAIIETESGAPATNVRLSAGEARNSPRALYLSAQSGAALASSQLRLNTELTLERDQAPSAPSAASSPRLVLPANAAIRVTFHAPGTAMTLDWRAPLPAGSVLRIDPTVPGFIAVIASDGETQKHVLASGQAATAHVPFDVAVTNYPGVRQLTVIYSADLLSQQSLSNIAATATGKTEEIHTPSEQAFYVSLEKESGSIVANLRIELR